jgi:hypothetical protein
MEIMVLGMGLRNGMWTNTNAISEACVRLIVKGGDCRKCLKMMITKLKNGFGLKKIFNTWDGMIVQLTLPTKKL